MKSSPADSRHRAFAREWQESVSRRGRFRGQAQKWFLLRFLGSDADLDVATHTDREFSEVRWVEPADLPDLIVGFKRELYQRVLDEFAGHLKR